MAVNLQGVALITAEVRADVRLSAMAATGKARYKFGLFEANLDSGELFRNGQKIRLQEQPFQVLVVLLERPGEVVTREELRQRLWATDTFVDFDHSLNTAINKLRDTLGDGAANPRFIETLPRRGYRFIAPVQSVSAETANDLPDRTETTSSILPNNKRRKRH